MDTAYDHDGDRVAPEVIELLSDDDDDDGSAQSARTTRHPPGTLVTATGLRRRAGAQRAHGGNKVRVRLQTARTFTSRDLTCALRVRETREREQRKTRVRPSRFCSDGEGGGTVQPTERTNGRTDERTAPQMSDDDLRGLVRDQLRAATEENRLESTTVRQIMDALEETYLVSLSGERKRFVREVVDEFIGNGSTRGRPTRRRRRRPTRSGDAASGRLSSTRYAPARRS